jgi:hypothetical protein
MISYLASSFDYPTSTLTITQIELSVGYLGITVQNHCSKLSAYHCGRLLPIRWFGSTYSRCYKYKFGSQICTLGATSPTDG